VEIVKETGSDAYVALAHELLRHGTVAAPRGLATRELTDVTLVVTDPTQVHVLGTARRPNLRIAATEAMHLVGGISSLAQLDLASGGRFSQFADDGRLRGAYGPRTHSQLLAVEARLRRDPATRQAVVTLWRGDELTADTRDTPCTTTFQFLLRNNRLEMRVTMRSNDAWLGLPYDLMMFSCLQRTLAAALGVEPGPYVHNVGSLHVYATDALKLLAAVTRRVNESSVDPTVTSGIPVPRPPFHNGAETFAAYASTANWVCLRLKNLRQVDDPGVEWLLNHVPLLPDDSYACAGCGYVVPIPTNCEECE
jgi:Thymidylate synthase